MDRIKINDFENFDKKLIRYLLKEKIHTLPEYLDFFYIEKCNSLEINYICFDEMDLELKKLKQLIRLILRVYKNKYCKRFNFGAIYINFSCPNFKACIKVSLINCCVTCAIIRKRTDFKSVWEVWEKYRKLDGFWPAGKGIWYIEPPF